MGCKMTGTRVDHGDAGPGGKNMKSGAASGGGPVASPRASVKIEGTDNSATFKATASGKVTRTGGK